MSMSLDPNGTHESFASGDQIAPLELLDRLPVAVSLARFADGYLVYANLALVALLRADGPHDVVGRPLFDFIDLRDLERVEGDFRLLRTVGALPEDSRFRIVRCDGSGGVVRVSSIPYEFRGEPMHLSVIMDETERVAAETARDAAEQRYDSLVEVAPEGIGVQIDGCYVFANHELARMLGATSADEIMGIPVLDTIAPDDRERAVAAMKSTLAGDSGGTRVAFMMQGCDGRRFPTEVSWRLVEYEGRTATQACMRELPQDAGSQSSEMVAATPQ